MARQPRNWELGALYHIIVRLHNHEFLASSKQVRAKYLELLAQAKKVYPVDILAYTLMDNHFHFQLQIPEDSKRKDVISRLFHKLHSGFARFVNRRRRSGNPRRGHRTGQVIQRFKSIRIQSNSPHILNCLLYILLNPVRAGIVKSGADCSRLRTSYRATILAEKDNIITLPEWFREMFDLKYLKQEVERRQQLLSERDPQMTRGRWIGDSEWVARQRLRLRHNPTTRRRTNRRFG